MDDRYSGVARFYDAISGDRLAQAQYLVSLIESHHPRARTIIEFACGTGALLERLRPVYRVAGVDISPAMLAIASARLPDVDLTQQDMTIVDLAERFDVVLCVYDSINHLPTFRQWEQVFDRASAHLAPGGIFIVDLNTPWRLAELARSGTRACWFGDGYLSTIDVFGESGSTEWAIKVFEPLGQGNYRLHESRLREVAFPIDTIRASLRRRFRAVHECDPERRRPSPRTRRLHFVCAGAKSQTE